MYRFQKTTNNNVIVSKGDRIICLIKENGKHIPYLKTTDKKELQWLYNRLSPVAEKEMDEERLAMKYASLLAASKSTSPSKLNL